MNRKIFILEWNESFGPEWMNIDNLRLCLFGNEHTQPELLEAEDVTEDLEKICRQLGPVTQGNLPKPINHIRRNLNKVVEG